MKTSCERVAFSKVFCDRAIVVMGILFATGIDPEYSPVPLMISIPEEVRRY